MRLKGKTIGILVGPGYEDLEFWVPYMRLKEEGAEVNVISSKSKASYTSKNGGLTAESQFSADEIAADKLNGLLVPGGWAPDKLRRDINILELVRNMNAQNKKGFNLMDQVKPRLIVPTHVVDSGLSAKLAAEKWKAFESYKKYLSLSIDNLPEETTIIFMGRNADLIKLPYSKL